MRPLLLTLALLAACTGPDTTIGKQKVDADGDGYAVEVDCDDTHATVHPDAEEVCDGVDNDCDGTTDVNAADMATFYADADGDGAGDEGAPTEACEAPDGHVADATDCDDDEPLAFPGNAEVCDAIDNDCDGEIDDDPSDVVTVYQDLDGDGWGDDDATDLACEAGPGWAAEGGDCDDAEAAVHPEAAETDCADPVDYNCDGSVGYADADGDGVAACEDCDDADEARSPLLVEVCDDADVDEDCDGSSDDDDASVTGAPTWGRDADGDGYAGAGATITQCEQPTGYASGSGDCDDFDSAANPGELEICDALDTDEDCDGSADDADLSTDASSWSTWYADRDGDAYGDASRTVAQCEAPANYVANDDDCDDTNAARNPGASEVCDAADVDEDCDGSADDADASVTGGTTYYVDADSDGYGGATTRNACSAPAGYVTNDDDCNDASASISPAATEVCDASNVDEDCDGLADDADASATSKSTWYRDADADGYAGTSTTSACDAPSGYLATSTDCNDGNAAISPAATEVCDASNVDEDCDGAADDADVSATGKSTWYRDADSDGYAGTTTASACEQPAGYLATSTDCNDASAAISPAAAEVCDASNVDEDCDGLADDSDTSATGKSTWYRDADTDTYGNAAVSTSTCDLPSGYVANDDDCDDTSSSIGSFRTWYRDADSDGYGVSSTTASSCSAPSGYVSTSGDCNDGAASISPGATEVCDASNTDEDCDGAADNADTSATGKSTWYRDADSDGYGSASVTTSTCDVTSGYVANSTDCNDASAAISPGDTEVCDASNVDEDCDGLADDADTGATGKTTWYVDADDDGYGAASSSLSRCDEPAGYVTTSTDCDDAEETAHPGGAEVCDDDIDQDCSGADEVCETGGFEGEYAVNTGYDVKIYGDTSGDDFGEAMVAGDFDGDGVGDLIVGASDDSYSSYRGYVFGYYGPFTTGVQTASANDAFGYYTNTSTYSGSWGYELHNVGDINADGKDDLFIQGDSDSTFLFYGGDTTVIPYGSYDADYSCTTAAPGGDFNATTGTDEWLCGNSAYSSSTGRAYAMSGSTTLATLPGESTSDFAGHAVAGRGDVNGDGYSDLWIGAYGDDDTATNAGAAYLVYAPVTGTFNLVGADVKVRGGAASDSFSFALASPGDLDGDGYDDLVSTAYSADVGYTDAGAVYVFTDVASGVAATVASAVISGESASDQVGSSAPEFGDFDGDGVLDMIVGAAGDDDTATNAGAVWLVYGPLTSSVSLAFADAVWRGTAASDYLGASYAAVPDTNGDGKDEIAMGATYGDERGYIDHGAVWIWLGE